MHNPESVPGNDTNESHNLGQTTRPCNNQQQQQKKKRQKENLPNCGLCCSGWTQSKIKRKWKER